MAGWTAPFDAAAALERPFLAVDRDVGSGFEGLSLGRLERIMTRVDNAAESCLKAGMINRRTAAGLELSRLFDALSRSPLARELLERAGRRGVYICIDGETKLLGYYRSGMRLIGLNPSLTEGQKIAFLAHELAHVPQHGVYSDNRYFPPHDLVLLRRMREAAAEAVATRIAWQLRQHGDPRAWAEKSADRFYGDIAEAFVAKLTADASPQGELAAARAAFDQWFAAAKRLDLYDRMTVDHLRRISGDAMGRVAPRRQLTHGFLAGIGRLDGWTPLFQPEGRPLTDLYYAGRLSFENAAIIECILEDDDSWTEALRPQLTDTGAPRPDEVNPWAVDRP